MSREGGVVSYNIRGTCLVASVLPAPDSPLTSDTHVLLENTRYHSKYEKEVDKRRHKFSKVLSL